jgi:CRISPR/Cas system-associated endonuclease Cas1
MSTVYVTEQGATLRQSSRHLVVTKGHEKRMLEPVAVASQDKKMSYREIIRNQVLTMNKSIKNRQIYQPYQMRW